jgi:hypothetical protein
MEGSGSGLIQILSQHLPGGTQENHENSEDAAETRTDPLPNKSTTVTARPTCSVREERIYEGH